MISNIDYMKLAVSYKDDKAEIDPIPRNRVWGVVLVGLAMSWSVIALTVCSIWIVG